MIRGQFPSQEWRLNPGGETRTIEEALAIAERHGVRIPDDVDFFVDEFGYLDATTTARGPRVLPRPPESPVTWSDLVHDVTGKVPFLIRPDVLKSDEAIVAVIAHEMYELEALRAILQEGRTSIDDFIRHTRPGSPGNLHDEAWNVADALIERMRGSGK
jgi:hypothetical protein